MTGGCSTRWWMSWRGGAWGSLLARPRPLARSSWRCSLLCCSVFLFQSALSGCAGGTSVLLPSFWSFWTRRPFNTPEKHGHKRLPPMTVRELRGSADRLYEVLLLPWMQSTKFRVICEAPRHLADALTKYADYLDSSTARVNCNVLHSQMEAARSPGRNILHLERH